MTSVRPATQADLTAMVDLDSALFGRNAWSPAAMQAELTGGPHRLVLVAAGDAEVVGYAVGLVAGDVVDLLRIGVAPTARRTGIATALLERLNELAAEAGCSRVLLEVDAADEGATAFYRHHGFVEIDRRRGYYPDGADAAVLARPLGPRRTT